MTDSQTRQQTSCVEHSALVLADQFVNWHVERTSDFRQSQQGYVELPPFDAADIGSLKPCDESKFLVGEPSTASNLPNLTADTRQ